MSIQKVKKMKNTFKFIVSAIALACAVTSVGAVTVSPLKLEIGAKKKATQLNIVNDSNVDKTYEIRMQKWDGVDESGRAIVSQVIGTPILLSKPVVTLKANQSAIIRLSVASRTADADSDFYRVYVDDVTPALEAAESESAAKLTFSVSLPLQVHIKEGTTANLQADIEKQGHIKNTGNNIAVLLGVEKEGKIERSLHRYVFPGESFQSDVDVSQIRYLHGIQ